MDLAGFFSMLRTNGSCKGKVEDLAVVGGDFSFLARDGGSAYVGMWVSIGVVGGGLLIMLLLPTLMPPDARTQELINEKLKKAEDLGEQGMVDEAQKTLEEAEALKKLSARQDPGLDSSKYIAADVRILVVRRLVIVLDLKTKTTSPSEVTFRSFALKKFFMAGLTVQYRR
ncbi:hypothetical protein MKW98_024625 [Papaver atlanticum]|uniref:Uncharacterized protein n=1 Tax=Papaver atlanticum TaxID=357466 RepID=A0AAD4S1Y7_9MAGN|nr:hypothetical protein MKW98_024625 [Papaver atlanticum]